MSETDSQGQTQSQGRSRGETDSFSQGQSQTQSASRGVGQSVAQGRSASQSTTQAESVSQGETRGLADSRGLTDSRQGSEGVTRTDSRGGSTSATNARSFTASESSATGNTEGTAEGATQSSTVSGSVDGKLFGVGVGGSYSDSEGQSATHSLGQSETEGRGTAQGQSRSDGRTDSSSTAQGQSRTDGWGRSLSQSQSSTAAESRQQGQSRGVGQSQGISETRAQTESVTAGAAQGQSQTRAQGVSQSATEAVAQSQSRAQGQSQSVTEGQARSQQQGWTRSATEGQSRQEGVAHSQQQSRGQSAGTSQTRSQTAGDSGGRSQTVGTAHSLGTSQTEGTAQGTSTGTSRSTGQATGTGHTSTQMLSQAAGMGRGLSGGLIPSLSLGRSYQTEDDSATRLTNLSRDLAAVLFSGVKDGAFLTSAWMLVEEGAAAAATALASQAFYGQNVPRPLGVQVLDAQDTTDLMPAMLTLRGDRELVTDTELIPWEGTEILWNHFATTLPASLYAAYWTPSLFEQGTALTMQEKAPPLAFYTSTKGEVILGHQVSPETDRLTRVPLRLDRPRHFHTAFCGDTGFGKSVAAERMAYETTLHWDLKTIVLDFGTGWRKMLNAPGLAGKVEIRQLSPNGVRPLRWNPLQIGRRIPPELHWRTFCDVFGAIAQLGEKRQIHELRNVLGGLYRNHGVFVDEMVVQTHVRWGAVLAPETAIAGRPAGTALADLTPAERQRVAVQRSRAVGFRQLQQALEDAKTNVSPRDIKISILEGIQQRLATFIEGGARAQYAAGDDAMDICEIVPDSGGMAILEGGQWLDDFTKAFLLGFSSWQIYADAVAEREGRAQTRPAHVQLVFEEANKILGGMVSRESESGGSVSERFEAMWRDSRKYGIWLHLMTQTPSAIPMGIMSSCNNLVASQLKNAKDRDLVTASMHRSEKSLTDEQWRKFMSRLPVGRAVIKLGYAMNGGDMEPVQVQPWMMDMEEPSDEEIAARLGRIALGPA